MLQGVQAPDVVVDPPTFYRYTRRMRFPMRAQTAIAGLGTSDSVQLKKTGVVAGLEVRIGGSVVIGGTIGTTTMSYEWPYNLVKAFKLSANGQSNLIDARGLTIKAWDFIGNGDVNDRGVQQRIGNATAKYQGTLSLASEDWGGTGAAANFMAPGLNVAAIATYPIDLTYFIPLAADQVSLVGSIYGQSQATNLNLEIVYSSQAELFSAVGGAATISFAGVTFDVTGVVYSIPNVGGRYVVPDLSQFHQISEFRQGGLVSGANEVNLPGTGAGRTLLRLLWNVYSSATPLAMNATNFSDVAWKYGGNDVPETLPNGQKLRALNERQTGCDIGANWGLALWDFASQHALRDAVDTGSTSDLRIVIGLVSSPTNGYVQLAQENLFAGAVGA
jgi:hypothetical protein